MPTCGADNHTSPCEKGFRGGDREGLMPRGQEQAVRGREMLRNVFRGNRALKNHPLGQAEPAGENPRATHQRAVPEPDKAGIHSLIAQPANRPYCQLRVLVRDNPAYAHQPQP